MTGEVSDEQMAKCFGKYRSCGRNCRLKDACLGEAKESRDEYHRKKYREACYIDGMDAGSGHVAPDFDANENDGYADDDPADGDANETCAAENDGCTDDAEIVAAIEQLDVSDRCRRELLRIFRTKTGNETAEGDVLELLRRLGEMYVHDQTGFEVLFFQSLAGGNQAALARRRGCSKQNINKIVAKGKKRLEAYRKIVAEHPECRLSCREIAVYHFVAVERFSYRNTGLFLGISKNTVRKIALGLTAKGFSCAMFTPVPRVAKIFAKIKRGEEVKNAETAIFEAACAPERSLREAAKIFHCSHAMIRKMRIYATQKGLFTPPKQ